MISETYGYLVFFAIGSLTAIIFACKHIMKITFDGTYHPTHVMSMTLILAIHIVISLVSWFADNYTDNMYLKYAFSYLSFLVPHIFFAFLFEYVSTSTGRGEKLKNISKIASLIFCIITTVLSISGNLFNYYDGHYHSDNLSLIVIIYPIAVIVLSLYFIAKADSISSEQRSILYLYLLIPMVGYGLDAVLCYFSYSARLCFVFSLFILMVIVNFDEYNKVMEQEYRLNQDRIEIMLAQIKPHFLYNTLNSIAGLCLIDPEQARKITLDLSNYLRANIDSLSSQDMIPFSKELEHIRTYVNIEKARFLDRVNVHYDVPETDFLVPALTIQPLVENAIKHGICKKIDGGTVTISSNEYPDGWVIKIIDNGVGFDSSAIEFSDDRSHIGISNVRNRIESQCNGNVSVKSIPGTGTEVLVFIPKK